MLPTRLPVDGITGMRSSTSLISTATTFLFHHVQHVT